MTTTITNTNDFNPYTAHVTVVEGCECPAGIRWFNCRCLDAMSTKYEVTPLNYEDCPDYPNPEGLAEVVSKYPGAKFVYMDCKVYGGGFGAQGLTLMQAARKVLDGRDAA